MLDVLMLFPRESDSDAVEGFLAERLMPALKAAPGLRSVKRSEGTLMSRGSAAPYSRVVQATFDGLADWMGVVDALNAGAASAAPADRDMLDRNAPLVLFYDVVDA